MPLGLSWHFVSRIRLFVYIFHGCLDFDHARGSVPFTSVSPNVQAVPQSNFLLPSSVCLVEGWRPLSSFSDGRLPRWHSGKESAYQCRRCKRCEINPGSGRSLGVGNGNSPQCSSLGNPMDRGEWWATVHGVTKSQTWLRDWTELYYLITTTF